MKKWNKGRKERNIRLKIRRREDKAQGESENTVKERESGGVSKKRDKEGETVSRK